MLSIYRITYEIYNGIDSVTMIGSTEDYVYQRFIECNRMIPEYEILHIKKIKEKC